MTLHKVNIAEKFGLFDEAWQPKIVGRVNDHDVRLARLRGSFEWHSHANEDEFFLVIEGRMRMRLRDGEIDLEPGEMVIIPRGVEHLPEADEEALVLLFEPTGTRNTGEAVTERTVEPEWI